MRPERIGSKNLKYDFPRSVKPDVLNAKKEKSF
jgi:hypothetical protein